MAEITAAAVGKLREMTSAGMMDCKKALTEAGGDIAKAVDILRKKGAATADTKASRSAREGVIAQHIAPGGRLGVLVEVNCESDFVGRNEMFRTFCDDITRKLAADPKADVEADRVAAVAKIRENIKIARHARMEVSGNGLVAAYIHTGAKVGVLVEVGAGKAETVATDDFKQLVRDITLQIAAGHPHAVSREQVPADVVAKEREIAAQSDRLKGKPAQAMEKILQGVLEKFYQTYCLVDQGFVKKNSEVSVKEHVATVAKQLGDEIGIRRFVRFQVGESLAMNPELEKRVKDILSPINLELANPERIRDCGPSAIPILITLFKDPRSQYGTYNQAVIAATLSLFARDGNRDALDFLREIATGKIALLPDWQGDAAHKVAQEFFASAQSPQA